ncbi:MAG: 5-deoxy-glucuronate isomerase [Tepidanaerobacteraceae bacterium]|nr:5-deoxy-glucuronate isomerase [Tepidanaerobacteraceae bacterium]
MQYFYHYEEKDGYIDVIKAKDVMKYVGAGVLKLDANKSYCAKSEGNEVVLVILSGKAHVKVYGNYFENLGERDDVFSGKATAVYIPKDSSYEVTEARGSQVEIAVLSSPAEKKFAPFVVTPGEVVANLRGMPGYRREVHDIIVENGEGRVDKIVVGETFSYPGEWSSYPSHKHDKFDPPNETEMEEIYLFKVKPKEGFGVQVMYNDDFSMRNAYIIKNNDMVAIPQGYHPVAAAPGFKLYYLWVMAGPSGRKLTPKDDLKIVNSMLR